MADEELNKVDWGELEKLYLEQKSGYLYVVECNGYYKIGHTTELENRMAELQVGNPHELKVICAKKLLEPRELETALHGLYERKKVRGEWYKLAKEDVKYLKNLCENA